MTAQQKRRMSTILRRLHKEYPESKCSLLFDTPLQLVLATILSAQCTDDRVNKVTPQLFARYPTAQDLADAKLSEVEEIIRSTGFFRNKARNLVGCAQHVAMHHKSKVPQTLDELVALPGVGRKTANVVLGNAFGIPGLVVDTHVTRIANLLELTDNKDAVKIEHDLMAVTARKEWSNLAHLFIDHGRKVCIARRPRCDACVLNDLCPSSLV
jgi:endonuclease-3